MTVSSYATGAILSGLGIVVGLIVGVAVASIAKTVAATPGLPIVQQLGSFSFTDDADLANRVMKVLGAGGDNGVVFGPSTYRTTNPVLLSTGYESGGAHYVYAYYWPYNNPGETTLDIGMIADLWVRPNNVWAVEISDFDLNPKTVLLDDGAGNTATIPLATTVFFDITQT